MERLKRLAQIFVSQIQRNKSEQECNHSVAREIVLKSEQITLEYALSMVNVELRFSKNKTIEIPEVKIN